jgi:LPXTG-motif cell wall-anchored protein
VAANEPIPALAVETTDLNTAPVIAITPEQKEVPVTEVIQTTAPDATPAPAVAATVAELPKTGSMIPLIALLGLGSLGVALTLKKLAS